MKSHAAARVVLEVQALYGERRFPVFQKGLRDYLEFGNAEILRHPI